MKFKVGQKVFINIQHALVNWGNIGTVYEIDRDSVCVLFTKNGQRITWWYDIKNINPIGNYITQRPINKPEET